MEQYEDRPVGEILRKTREYYGQSLDDVEAILRIRRSHLNAIEKGHVHELPGRVYAIGFVRTYAEYLGLDGDKVVYLFKNQAVGNKDKPELNFPVPASESKIPNKYVLIASFLALVTVVAGWVYYSSSLEPENKNITVVQAPPALQEVSSMKTVQIYGPVRPSDLAAIEPAAGTDAIDVLDISRQVVINITESAWVEIRDEEGKAVVSRVLNPGDSYTVPADASGYVLDSGNAAGLEILVGEQKIGALGGRGDILRDMSLEPDSLKKLAKPDETGQEKSL